MYFGFFFFFWLGEWLFVIVELSDVGRFGELFWFLEFCGVEILVGGIGMVVLIVWVCVMDEMRVI